MLADRDHLLIVGRRVLLQVLESLESLMKMICPAVAISPSILPPRCAATAMTARPSRVAASLS